ncbi:phosphoribosyltransferase [Elizabethkingia sp. HvH-WGS333]|uniref:ComF family protein n=1 Tax=Elizabethkingia TaxID=308865 RepID=UPI0007415358|nr:MULTISPECIES: double zinc ribbon domain-containing protein [Elizabethkingia]KUG13598.1 phosphoribosyltransferase [Elizabethkingia miricola]MCL1655992.1 double zinc ribbon domain-containing protein [Elizabethkingia miricola]MDX8566684.1 double zinc ribbon domain-containing protein [Elizabethkingia sp. HX XZB]OIK47271.1 phosphoribosyltransferase [Elizabethkingia sp. HvH-WGS333]
MNFFTDILFPNRCLQCNHIIGGKDIICEECYDQVDFIHWESLPETPLQQRLSSLFPIENSYALMNFEKEGLSRKLIHNLKYANREIIGDTLARWTAEKINLKSKPDILINIPLHIKKLKKRGYNQLHRFTEILSKEWNIPYNHHYLKRTAYSTAQARKKLIHRKENLNIFTVPNPVENIHFLLIDDVCTTGSTLASCAWEILKTPGNKLSVLVMAID